ncbi:MAG: holo-ACP synthase [Rickettsiaceae bacterium]|nr:holo-ACP synthase [Rickettsiaceae bacterium]MDP4832975.1 holo-ACP synthase [Rickettsiaceae bacterium]MDP5020516.1 holo-ACP synthase [Rickettsiaceae bacterium]MDP5083646.1 holo-ACP synthase [Rickettsiaceae bacterium]
MIVGIGTDIVNIERIEHIYSKFGDDFVYKNFHKLEIAYLTTLTHAAKIGYLAKRFAAKEAVAKALGIGIGHGLAFKDIAVVNNESGAPQVLISEAIYPSINEYNIHISLSDDHPFAVAFVTVSK